MQTFNVETMQPSLVRLVIVSTFEMCLFPVIKEMKESKK